jgi:gas vesicle protein
MKITTEAILAFAAGAVAGAAIGMLLTPEKGKDLQVKLKDGAQDLLNQFSDLLNTGRDVAAEIKSNPAEKIENLKAELHETK